MSSCRLFAPALNQQLCSFALVCLAVLCCGCPKPPTPEHTAAVAKLQGLGGKFTFYEGGYSLNQVTGEFDPTPAVQADLDADPGTPPATVFGLVTEGLRRRREEP